jgi:hypothetical protein
MARRSSGQRSAISRTNAAAVAAVFKGVHVRWAVAEGHDHGASERLGEGAGGRRSIGAVRKPRTTAVEPAATRVRIDEDRVTIGLCRAVVERRQVGAGGATFGQRAGSGSAGSAGSAGSGAPRHFTRRAASFGRAAGSAASSAAASALRGATVRSFAAAGRSTSVPAARLSATKCGACSATFEQRVARRARAHQGANQSQCE